MFIDKYQGKPKILFIGLAESSHTVSWIDLLNNEGFNIRLFAVPTGGLPPSKWKVPVYLPLQQPVPGLDKAVRQTLYSNHIEFGKNRARFEPILWIWNICRKILNFGGMKLGFPRLVSVQESVLGDLAEYWLAEIIQEWQPDIVHTLGVDHNQGGLFFLNTVKQKRITKNWIWIAHLRGGSDLTLNRHDPKKLSSIREVLESCDQIISDNIINIKYVVQMGIPQTKFADITPVPGTGGVNIDELSKRWKDLPSKRERIILWPKVYDCEWALALPVFEALQKCWEQIQPCEVYMLTMTTPGTRDWYNAMPEHIRAHCHVYGRLPRDKVFSILLQARVLLSPSLVDGIPNVLYEAMASGTFPIVSPLETIMSIMEEEENVLFARNLYPEEIANALVRAMNDDNLVDSTAKNNLEKVYRLADRKVIKQIVSSYYKKICGKIP